YDQVLAGIEIKDGGNPVLRRCKVHDCKQAGVLFTKNAQGSLEECDIYGNGLSAVEVRQGGSPVLRRCKIHDSKLGGVLVVEKSAVTLEDSDIFSNRGSGV